MNLRNIALGLTLILGSFGLANGQCTYSAAVSRMEMKSVSKWNEQLLRKYITLAMVLTVPLERLGTMTLTFGDRRL